MNSVVVITFTNAARVEYQFYAIVPLVLSCSERTYIVVERGSVELVIFRMNIERCIQLKDEVYSSTL